MNYGGLRNDHFDTPAQINQKFLLLVLCVRHLVDEDFPASSKHLDSGRCRTVRLPSVDVDCCVPCSNAFAIRMPTRTQRAGRAAAAALTAPSSQRRRNDASDN